MNLNKKLELHKKWLNDEVGGVRADLRGADLIDANLIEANLRRADLIDANLYRTNLRRAYLERADLYRADLGYANLREASLRGADLRKADLRYADLRGADLREADLRGANLIRANLRESDLTDTKIDYRIEDGLLKKVAEHALKENALDMFEWHSCDTTHCIAGWACCLAENAKELEKRYGTQIAGLLLLGSEAHSHFFDDNQKAKRYLKSVLENS